MAMARGGFASKPKSLRPLLGDSSVRWIRRCYQHSINNINIMYLYGTIVKVSNRNEGNHWGGARASLAAARGGFAYLRANLSRSGRSRLCQVIVAFGELDAMQPPLRQ